MKRKDAERKRDRAIRALRDLGMTDEEIANELGSDGLTDETAQADSANPVDSDGIIDAEIVSVEDDPSTDQAMESDSEPVSHLPGVIAQPKSTDNQRDSIPYRQWSEQWWQNAKPEVQQRRCKAHKKDGSRCLKAAINGATVCRYHGGAARHVKAAARARLENATDLMAKQLLRMAINDNVADAVKLSAIKDALDRGGLKAPNEVVLSPGQTSGFDEVFDGIYSGPRTDRFESDAHLAETPPAPAMDADTPQAVSRDYGQPDSYGPPAPQADDSRSPRQSQRARAQNRYTDLSDDDAIRLANEENAALAERYGLPWGKSSGRGW